MLSIDEKIILSGELSMKVFYLAIYILISFLICNASLAYAENQSEIDDLRKELNAMKKNHKKQIEQIQTEHEMQLLKMETRLKSLEEDKKRKELEARVLKMEKDYVNIDEAKDQIEEGILGKLQSVISGANRTFPSMFNPSASLIVDSVGKYNSIEGRDNSIDMRTAELYLYGSVDPYVTAYAVIQGHDTNEVELHEAAAQLSLPWYFTLKGGKFFADFGSVIAKSHDHDLPFVDRPPSLIGQIGGEPIVTGAELGWMVPIDHYIHFTAGMYDDFEGELHGYDEFGGHSHDEESTVHRSTDDFAYLLRTTTAASLHKDHNFDFGATYLNDPSVDRQTYGFDMTYNWYPLSQAQHQQLTFGLEFVWNRQPREFARERLLPFGEPNHHDEENEEHIHAVEHEDDEEHHDEHAEDEEDHDEHAEDEEHEHHEEIEEEHINEDLHRLQHNWGGYTYVQYKFLPKWLAGLRFDVLQHLNDDFSDYTYTYTYSPYVTFKPSENHRWRVQYNYKKLGHELADSRNYGHEVFVQWTVNLGSHKHPFRY